MKISPRFHDALSLASEVHAGQVRKGTQIPYIAHVIGVTSIVLRFGGNEDEAIGGLLHDTIEDAKPPLTPDILRARIRDQFGDLVLEIVEGCTDSDVTPKPPWLKRKEAYIARVAGEPAPVILVSAADKLHNATAILNDYRAFHDNLWMRFNPEAGKAGTVGYYRGLVTAYRSTGHHKELINALDTVVGQLEAETGHKGKWPPNRA